MKKSLLASALSFVVLGAALGSVCLVTGKCQAKAEHVSIDDALIESVSPDIEYAPNKAKRRQAAKKIRWLTSLDEARKLSKSSGKPIFVDFYATWCPPCKMLEAQTYPNAKVIAESQNWIMVKIDTDKQTDLAVRYGITSLPTLTAMKSDGKPLIAAYGFLEAADFLRFLRDAKTKLGQ